MCGGRFDARGDKWGAGKAGATSKWLHIMGRASVPICAMSAVIWLIATAGQQHINHLSHRSRASKGSYQGLFDSKRDMYTGSLSYRRKRPAKTVCKAGKCFVPEPLQRHMRRVPKDGHNRKAACHGMTDGREAFISACWPANPAKRPARPSAHRSHPASRRAPSAK